jgi:hypothetical protein
MSASIFPREPAALPENFLAYLEQRLGLGEGDVFATLSHWVSSYEPGPTARAHADRPHVEALTTAV